MSEQLVSSHNTDSHEHRLRQYGDQFLWHTTADSVATARSLLTSGGHHFIDPANFLFMHVFKGERFFFFRSLEHGVVALRDGTGEMVYSANGRDAFREIAETYRPDEGVKLWEAFSPTDIAVALSSSSQISVAGGQYILQELLGEGFESVALRAKDAHGRDAVIKIGKIDLSDNYAVMRPLLVEMRSQGSVTPQYLDYDPNINAILMEDAGPQTLEFKMKTDRDSTSVLRSILQVIRTLKSLENRLGMHHGDPGAANMVVQHPEIALIDFRFSLTIPFNSEIYRRRDIFTIMYTLYQHLYGRQALCILETKNSIHRLESPTQPLPEQLPIIYPAVQQHQALREFLLQNLYRPEGVDLDDLEELVAQLLPH